MTLTADQIPAHVHKGQAASATSVKSLLQINLGVQDVVTKVTTSSTDGGPAGGGRPHDNMPPWIAMAFYVYAGVAKK